MQHQYNVHQLRQIPTEWHRRGMSSPAEIDALVNERLGQPRLATVAPSGPSYADFFRAPTAA
ncbi:hypothetical protein [Curtobacterium sp. ME12]|uniref:hypothetical protein n=1 Tax=Curtobacterium sp. ME12 TaxID=2744253 RepID=UPI0015F447AC|nr:hypothetical protein [Curtobacterium sp. ME12]